MVASSSSSALQLSVSFGLLNHSSSWFPFLCSMVARYLKMVTGYFNMVVRYRNMVTLYVNMVI